MLILHQPSAAGAANTSTLDCGGENAVAFSNTSAKTRTRSDTSGAATVTS
jgi:hypothetical protein